MNTSGLNMFTYDEMPQQLMPEPPPFPRHQPVKAPFSHPHRQLQRAETSQGHDASVVSPVFFGYDVQQPPSHSPHQHHQPLPAHLQHQQQRFLHAQPPQHQHNQAPQGHQQHPHTTRQLPAAMGFSAPAMTQERQLQQNPAISYYQAYQSGATLDGIDSGLFSNYDISIEQHPRQARAMYMTDHHGVERIVQEPASTNDAYRLYKS